MATKLTEKQLKAFEESFLRNELDVIFSTIPDSEKVELFKTTDRAEITQLLKDGIKDIKTVEDIREGFDYEYDHIFS